MFYVKLPNINIYELITIYVILHIGYLNWKIFYHNWYYTISYLFKNFNKPYEKKVLNKNKHYLYLSTFFVLYCTKLDNILQIILL